MHMCKLAGGGVGSFLSHSVPERRRSMAEWLGKKLRSELVPYVSCCTIRRCSCRNKLDSYVPVPLATIVAPFVRATVRISLVRAAALRSVAFCIAFGPSLRVALRPALQQHCALQRLRTARDEGCLRSRGAERRRLVRRMGGLHLVPRRCRHVGGGAGSRRRLSANNSRSRSTRGS